MEAIGYLQSNPDVAWIFLDHDLDPGAYIGEPGEATGMDVARFLAENLTTFSGLAGVVIHSLNPVGSEAMYVELDEAKVKHNNGFTLLRIPFAWSKVGVR